MSKMATPSPPRYLDSGIKIQSHTGLSSGVAYPGFFHSCKLATMKLWHSYLLRGSIDINQFFFAELNMCYTFPLQ